MGWDGLMKWVAVAVAIVEGRDIARRECDITVCVVVNHCHSMAGVPVWYGDSTSSCIISNCPRLLFAYAFASCLVAVCYAVRMGVSGLGVRWL